MTDGPMVRILKVRDVCPGGRDIEIDGAFVINVTVFPGTGVMREEAASVKIVCVTILEKGATFSHEAAFTFNGSETNVDVNFTPSSDWLDDEVAFLSAHFVDESGARQGTPDGGVRLIRNTGD
jgi:hypothetical protein